MFLEGDEFCRTRLGNNNPYCQDNEISWIDWSLLEKNKDVFEFFQYMIRFRKNHMSIRGDVMPSTVGFPFISTHGPNPWRDEITENSKFLGVLFAGYDRKKRHDDLVYLAINVYWEDVEIHLPSLPEGSKWQLCVNTGAVNQEEYIVEKKKPSVYVADSFWMRPRSVAVFIGRP